jgi:hypothetical protein
MLQEEYNLVELSFHEDIGDLALYIRCGLNDELERRPDM